MQKVASVHGGVSDGIRFLLLGGRHDEIWYLLKLLVQRRVDLLGKTVRREYAADAVDKAGCCWV